MRWYLCWITTLHVAVWLAGATDAIASTSHITTDIHLTGMFLYNRKPKCEMEIAVRLRPREHQQRIVAPYKLASTLLRR